MTSLRLTARAAWPVWMLAAGCRAVTLTELDGDGDLAVALDANCRAVTAPSWNPRIEGHWKDVDNLARAHNATMLKSPEVKFFIDMTNNSGRTITLAGLKIELQAFREGRAEEVQLRQSWTYRYTEGHVHLKPGRKFTIPIVPERGEQPGEASEFPLERLPEGAYEVVAVVNGRHISTPYKLRVVRPDLNQPLRRV